MGNRYSIVLSAIWAIALCPLATKADDSLPRYSFPPGRSLVYSSTHTYSGELGAWKAVGSWDVLVTRNNVDGSSHLIFHRARMVSVEARGKVQATPEAEIFLSADIMPDGTLISDSTLGQNEAVNLLFPKLPNDESESAAGWMVKNPHQMLTRSFKVSPGNPGELDIEYTRYGPIETIENETFDGKASFDPMHGFLSEASDIDQLGYGGGTFNDEIKLSTNQMISASDADRMGRQFDIYFAANHARDVMIDAADFNPETTESMISKAEAQFTQSTKPITMPVVLKQCEMASASAWYTENGIRGSAHAFHPFINKPVVGFDTADYDGNFHKLSDYRGKVIVLDSWHRGCEACMHLMPELHELEADFKDKPVAFLGEDYDVKADAEVVIDTFKIDYPTLYYKNAKPFEAGMLGDPATFIIDQNGVLRVAHTGYSPMLYEEFSKTINSLLK